MSNDDQKDQEVKVLELIREAVKHDEELRKQYNVGDKFRFVRDRLHSLLESLESSVQSTQKIKQESNREAGADEITAYVYLYNAHGVNLRSWLNMLTPKVFFEYSVNRPVYAEKNYIESLLRSKTNKLQHAYLTIAIKPEDVVKTSSELKDSAGNPLIKVKEGSLRFEKLLMFTHAEHNYTLNEEGELVKKN